MNTTKKILSAFLAAVLLAAAMMTVSCGNDSSGELVMATNAQFEPYEFYGDDGKITGIDVEIMTKIAEKLGKTLRIEDMDFDSIVAAVQTGKCDVGAAGLSITEERKQFVNFTDTYTTAKQVIIVKEDSDIAGPDDLNGKIIGTQTGTTGELYVTDDYEAEGLATVERFKSGNEAVLALTQGKVDCVVIDNNPAEVFVQKNPGLKILETEYTLEEYAFAVAKGNNDLLEKINKAVAELKESGELQAIIDKYIHD
jgi:polar amino acid transport system substrate-binding protein